MQTEINDLPPRYQEQARRKLEKQNRAKKLQDLPAEEKQPEKQNKYRNKKPEYNGITFDSQKEMRRYIELVGMQEAGLISDLHLQEHFTLQETFTFPDGETVRGRKYIADFTYYDQAGNWIIEDVKGMKTQSYIDKKKEMAKKGFRIKEV